jgi:hypothetical protein
VESWAGVRRFADRLRREKDLARSVTVAVGSARRRRRALAAAYGLSMLDDGASLRTGIGGVADARTLKCLHAHAAHALARPGYRLGEEVLAEAGALWCSDRRCAVWSDGA